MQVRPTGVTVLAVLAIIAGAFAVFAGLAFMAFGAFAGAAGISANSGTFGALGALGALAGIAFLVYAAFAFAVAYGMFKKMRWAWYAGLVLAGLGALGAIMSLVSAEFFSGLLSLAISAVIVWYLLSPPVQTWFGVSYKAPWTYRQMPPHA